MILLSFFLFNLANIWKILLTLSKNNMLFCWFFFLLFSITYLLFPSARFEFVCMCAELFSSVCLFMTPWSPVPWNFLGKNTGTDCHYLLQGIFPTQGLNPHLLHWRVAFLPLSHRCEFSFVFPPTNSLVNLNCYFRIPYLGGW